MPYLLPKGKISGRRRVWKQIREGQSEVLEIPQPSVAEPHGQETLFLLGIGGGRRFRYA